MEWLGIDRRRLGTAMTAFGLVGLALAGVMAVALGFGAVAARDLDERIAADQAKIGASLTRLTQTMESVAITTSNAATTLETSGQSIADAEALLETAATTLDSLAASLDISLLGNKPFASAADNVGQLATAVRSYKSRAATLGANLHQNSSDATVVAGQIRQLKKDVNEVATRIVGFDRVDQFVALVIGGIVLAALLTAWVALAGGFVAWVGWRLRRIALADGAAASTRKTVAPTVADTAEPEPAVADTAEPEPAAAATVEPEPDEPGS
jgi:hypothetical protein